MTGRDQFALEFETPPASPGRPERSPERENGEQDAVLAFDTDLVVAAGAGSGKTTVLVDLYVRILEHPELVGIEADEIGPRRILCLTFTERAAREIQERIRGRIDRPEWLRELETAPIQTFHAWCARLLRDYPLEAGVDPRFTVLTEEAALDLLRRAALDVLRRGVETGEQPCLRVVEMHGLVQGARHLVDLVRDIRTAGWAPREAIARFEERIAEVTAEADGPLRDSLDAAADALVAAIRPGVRSAGSRDRLANLERCLSDWRRSPTAGPGEALGLAIKDSRGAPPERAAAVEVYKSWRAARVESDHPHDLGLWPALAATVRAEYRAFRSARAALDYDDLLLRARELLTSHEGIRRSHRRRYRAVLIDEHQDTDPVQHEILQLLVGADSLAGRRGESDSRWCVVGDVQQAIYGFRGANVVAFATLVREADGRKGLRRLVANYRSGAELVAFHNLFFPRVLTAGPHAEAVAYTTQESRRPPAGARAVEVLLPGEERPAKESRDVEARALAARLRAALDPASPDAVRVFDRSTREWRDARPGDVAVLFRRLTQVEPYRRALQSVGLEPVVVGSGSFYARQEVFDVLNALEAALAPEDPIPLVAFLRSPMVGLTDDAIWRLTSGWERHARSLAAPLEHAAPHGAPEERELLDEGRVILDQLRARTDRESPAAVVAWLLDRTGYQAIVDGLPDAVQRRANLARLVAIADSAPSDGLPLLADWVAVVRSRADRPPRDRDAALPESGDRVMIMSIHQAKGLEFPIVALADIGGTARGGLGGVAFDPALGVVAKWQPDGGTEGEPTRSYTMAKDSAERREEAEEARLLYVAATRARDRLILSAGSRGARQGWWLSSVVELLESGEATEVVEVHALETWAERHARSVIEIEMPDPGETYRPTLRAAPGEITARALAAVFGPEQAAPRHPAAREAGRLRMLRGDRAHRLLERLPLPAPPSFGLREWLAAGEMEEPDLGTVADFVERELRPRLATATEVHRELPFRLRLPAPGGIVVGTIDCLWRDPEGGWWVWDYKLASDEDPEIRHQVQLSIYALAAAAMTGADEVRGALWYLESGRAREERWDAARLRDEELRLADAFSLAAPATTDEGLTE